jgi:hypothetical protein
VPAVKDAAEGAVGEEAQETMGDYIVEWPAKL